MFRKKYGFKSIVVFSPWKYSRKYKSVILVNIELDLGGGY